MKEPTTCKEVLLVEGIAKACHEVNRTYCISMGDTSQRPWDEAEEWQRESARRGVQFALANPYAQCSDQHEAWLKDKLAAGWIYGPVKDADKKTHPCCVPWDELPFEQRIKDFLFKATVKAFMAGRHAVLEPLVPAGPPASYPNPRRAHLEQLAELRRNIDTQIQAARNIGPHREMALVVTKLQEASMWAMADEVLVEEKIHTEELRKVRKPYPFLGGDGPK